MKRGSDGGSERRDGGSVHESVASGSHCEIRASSFSSTERIYRVLGDAGK